MNNFGDSDLMAAYVEIAVLHHRVALLRPNVTATAASTRTLIGSERTPSISVAVAGPPCGPSSGVSVTSFHSIDSHTQSGKRDQIQVCEPAMMKLSKRSKKCGADCDKLVTKILLEAANLSCRLCDHIIILMNCTTTPYF
ncbi:hypothetical protein DY000_02012709 [Brassica cretica]|uniref:Uncharacterized protein n=1 Tax=Brassica cretica TaxID=69181 RepID=A0ABQ7D2J4_BRACR|nr:hypothetical protein DY000_02012709 [Brassica cretica]